MSLNRNVNPAMLQVKFANWSYLRRPDHSGPVAEIQLQILAPPDGPVIMAGSPNGK